MQTLQSKVLPDGSSTELEKLLKLYNTHSLSNMHLFNHEEKLKKYENVEEIINDFYDERYKLYEKRKQYLIKILSDKLNILKNKLSIFKNFRRNN